MLSKPLNLAEVHFEKVHPCKFNGIKIKTFTRCFKYLDEIDLNEKIAKYKTELKAINSKLISINNIKI